MGKSAIDDRWESLSEIDSRHNGVNANRSGNLPGSGTMDRLIRKYLVAPAVLTLGAGFSGCSENTPRPASHTWTHTVIQASASETDWPRQLPASILALAVPDVNSRPALAPQVQEFGDLDRASRRTSSVVEASDRLPERLPQVAGTDDARSETGTVGRLDEPLPGQRPSLSSRPDSARHVRRGASELQQPTPRLETEPKFTDNFASIERLPEITGPALAKAAPWEKSPIYGPQTSRESSPSVDANVAGENRSDDVADPVSVPDLSSLTELLAASPRDEALPIEPTIVRLPAIDEDPETDLEPQAPSERIVPLREDPIEEKPLNPSLPSDELRPAEIVPPAIPIQTTPAPRPCLNPAVAERADAIARKGMSLTTRGAFFSARAELIQALRLIAQGLDAQTGGMERSRALANGLRALDEAESFLPRGSHLEADLNLETLIQSHRSPVLKGQPIEQLSPLLAMQYYYGFAQEQLSVAFENEPAASLALFGLGKIETVISNESPQASRATTPRAMTYHQAALHVDRNNFRAANELGVLLARCGQWPQARDVLQLSVQIFPQSETWHNLAAVHERLGEPGLAQVARQQMRLCKSQAGKQGYSVGGSADELVQWMNVQDFVRDANANGIDPLASPAINAPPARAAATPPRSASSPWRIMPK